MHADGMRYLRCCVDVQIGGVGDHAPKQADVYRVVFFQDGFDRLFRGGHCSLGIIGLQRGEREIGESIVLSRPQKQQVPRFVECLLIVIIGVFFVLGGIELQTARLEDLCSKFGCSVGADLRIAFADAVGEHLHHSLGANTQAVSIEQRAELLARGAFPGLAGDPGARHPTIDRALRAAGVISIEIARGNSLEDADVEDSAGVHDVSF